MRGRGIMAVMGVAMRVTMAVVVIVIVGMRMRHGRPDRKRQ